MPKKLNRDILFLILITAAGFLLRFILVDKIPAGLFCDEAANGYNAYSLLITGRDFSGQWLPIMVRHLAIDYVDPLYIYTTVPLVAFFGLNVLATRLAAVLIGTLTIPLLYFLGRRLFGASVGLVAALILALSPWSLIFSRIAFAGVFMPFFTTLGLLLLFKIWGKPRWFIAASFVWGISLYSYAIMHAFVPLVLIAFTICYWPKIQQFVKEQGRLFYSGLAIFVALALPIYYYSFFSTGDVRFNRIAITNAPAPFIQFWQNLWAHLSPQFLFHAGDTQNLRQSVPGYGLILIVLAPFIALAIYYFITKRRRNGLFIITLALLGLVPASLTNEFIPHALRAMAAVPFWELLAAGGIVLAASLGKKYGKILLFIILAAIIINFSLFAIAYFTKYPITSADNFQSGVAQAISEAKKLAAPDEKIILVGYIMEGQIFPLFYDRLDPRLYQVDGSLGRYQICNAGVKECLSSKGIYIVAAGSVVDIPDWAAGHKILKTITYTDGQAAYYVLQ